LRCIVDQQGLGKGQGLGLKASAGEKNKNKNGECTHKKRCHQR
jgi:hypothetical protein